MRSTVAKDIKLRILLASIGLKEYSSDLEAASIEIASLSRLQDADLKILLPGCNMADRTKMIAAAIDFVDRRMRDGEAHLEDDLLFSIPLDPWEEMLFGDSQHDAPEREHKAGDKTPPSDDEPAKMSHRASVEGSEQKPTLVKSPQVQPEKAKTKPKQAAESEKAASRGSSEAKAEAVSALAPAPKKPKQSKKVGDGQNSGGSELKQRKAAGAGQANKEEHKKQKKQRQQSQAGVALPAARRRSFTVCDRVAGWVIWFRRSRSSFLMLSNVLCKFITALFSFYWFNFCFAVFVSLFGPDIEHSLRVLASSSGPFLSYENLLYFAGQRPSLWPVTAYYMANTVFSVAHSRLAEVDRFAEFAPVDIKLWRTPYDAITALYGGCFLLTAAIHVSASVSGRDMDYCHLVVDEFSLPRPHMSGHGCRLYGYALVTVGLNILCVLLDPLQVWLERIIQKKGGLRNFLRNPPLIIVLPTLLIGVGVFDPRAFFKHQAITLPELFGQAFGLDTYIKYTYDDIRQSYVEMDADGSETVTTGEFSYWLAIQTWSPVNALAKQEAIVKQMVTEQEKEPSCEDPFQTKDVRSFGYPCYCRLVVSAIEAYYEQPKGLERMQACPSVQDWPEIRAAYGLGQSTGYGGGSTEWKYSDMQGMKDAHGHTIVSFIVHCSDAQDARSIHKFLERYAHVAHPDENAPLASMLSDTRDAVQQLKEKGAKRSKKAKKEAQSKSEASPFLRYNALDILHVPGMLDPYDGEIYDGGVSTWIALSTTVDLSDQLNDAYLTWRSLNQLSQDKLFAVSAVVDYRMNTTSEPIVFDSKKTLKNLKSFCMPPPMIAPVSECDY